jgi:predicted branched-subunit amino acid permease
MNSLLGLLGYIGVVFMLLAYFLLVLGQMKVTDTHHIMLNVLGALFVVIAMHTGNPVPLFATLVIWLFISLYGLYKHHIATAE